MKTSILLLSILALTGFACSTPHPVDAFYYEYKSRPEVRNFTVPGWMVRMGTGIARNHVEEYEEQELLSLGRYIHRVRVMQTERKDAIPAKAVQKMMSQARGKGFEDLLYVRDDGTMVNILIQESKNSIRELLIVVHEPDEFVLLEIEADLPMDKLERSLKIITDEYVPKSEAL